ncbi:isoprenylcysteine carboxyl methyltransferase family protein [Streptococcus panodentis]|uniref:Isoprenylcysteine carboxyl methyltransferase n=1 Tax=Streptococcus panodentis TaxID=1581472 RepID=A0ABS5AYQ0_9STRE|nr:MULTISPECIES: isoprenylcysteine carboxyl methyltransferase family protein [Streptococcus]KXT82500.1 hypothetical protein STRDD11_01839 [Streptococcus sp. DD11]MBP2621650.1 hypothetical protein [Streptococcus panodentis]
MTVSLVIYALVFVLRLVFLRTSSRNEQAILAAGGREYGVKNSTIMKYLHILFYLLCLGELVLRRPDFDGISLLGAVLLAFSMLMLYLVAKLLGPVWTIKLMLVKDHKFVDHWLFRNVKHPNYFFNVVPELLGLALLCHAYLALFLLFPIYCITLYVRIKEEEQLLREVIIPNGTAGE